MAKLPSPEDLGGLPLRGAASRRARLNLGDQGAPGRALAGLGQAIAGAGAAFDPASGSGSGAGGVREFGVEKSLLDFEYAETKARDDFFRSLGPNELEGAAERYAENYKKRADAFARSNLVGLDDAERARYDQRLYRNEIEAYGAARKFETTESYNATIRGINQTIEETLLPQYASWAQSEDRDPQKLQELDTKFAELLSTAPISELERQTIYESGIADLHKGAAISLPERERAALDEVAGKGTPGEVGELRSSILRVANDLGIDPVDLATVISYETGGTFDPWKKGPTTKWGEHRGLIQWGEPQRAKYGVTADTSITDQLMAVGAYLKDAGVRPGMGLLDVYSAINAGSVGRYGARDAAQGGAPGTVVDKVRGMAGHHAKAQKLLGGGGEISVARREGGYGPTRTALWGLSTEDTFKIANAGRAAQQKRSSEFRDDMKDMLAFVSDGGDPAMLPPMTEIARVLTPEDYAEFEADLEKSMLQGAAMNDVALATPDELARLSALAEGIRNDPNDYRADKTYSETLDKAIADRETALASDPVKYVLEHDSDAAKALSTWQGAGTQEESVLAANAYADAVLAQQERLGVPAYDRRILTDGQAKGLAANLLFQGEGEQSIVQSIQTMAQMWGQRWPQVLKELSGDLPPVVRVIASMDLPEQSLGAEMLAESLKLSKEEQEAGISSDDLKEMNDAVVSTMDTSGWISSTRAQGGGATLNRDIAESIRRLALMRVQRGMSDPDNAVDDAFNDIIGARYQMIQPIGQDNYIRIPKEVNPTRGLYAYKFGTNAGTTTYRATYNAEHEKQQIDALNLDMPRSLIGLNEADTKAAYVDALKANGTWVTSPDEDGLALVDESGDYVTVNGGELYVVPWETLEQPTEIERRPLPPISEEQQRFNTMADSVFDALGLPKIQFRQDESGQWLVDYPEGFDAEANAKSQQKFNRVMDAIYDRLKEDGAIPELNLSLPDSVPVPSFEWFYNDFARRIHQLAPKVKGGFDQIQGSLEEWWNSR